MHEHGTSHGLLNCTYNSEISFALEKEVSAEAKQKVKRDEGVTGRRLNFISYSSQSYRSGLSFHQSRIFFSLLGDAPSLGHLIAQK